MLTDGSKGTWDPDEDIAALVATREVEQRAAAAAIGATGQVVMLGEVDGELRVGPRRRASGSPTGSACCDPRSCSATTRGGATGCTPTTATPVG